MIDVLKRLAELDAKNPNIVKENQQPVEECGMGMMPDIGRPSTPASINMTAGSGEELSDMLTTIMSLAGVNKHDDGLSVSPMMAPPVLEPVGPEPSATDSMRSVIDKLNPSDDQDSGEEDDQDSGEEDDESPEKADETVDSQPNPTMQPTPPGNQDPAGSPGAADGRNMMNNPVATPKEETTFESLMSEYQQFIHEDSTT